MSSRRSSAYRDPSGPQSKESVNGSGSYTVPLAVGDCVEVSKSRVAVIKYIGPLRDNRGTWYGIEFVDGSVGSHNGVYQNVIYFKGADKRCEFMHRGDIRRKLTFRSNSTRDLGFHDHRHHDHHGHGHGHDHHERTSSRSTVRRNRSVSPTLPLPEPVISSAITLYLRCQCFADPVPIELRLNENEVTLKELKLKIVEECRSRTALPLFKEHHDAEWGDMERVDEAMDVGDDDEDDDDGVDGDHDSYRSMTDKVDIYRLTMMRSSHSPWGQSGSVRVNSLNVQSGNMAHCILKRNAECFKKLALSANPMASHKAAREEAENAPLRYYRVGDGETLYVLFTFSVSIKVLFQKTLFSKMHRKQSESVDHAPPRHGGYASATAMYCSGTEDKVERTESDESQYVHHRHFRVPLSAKFEDLYRRIMAYTAIANVNCVKLLSTNFIYNKSMMIEKFVFNTVDEEADSQTQGQPLPIHQTMRQRSGPQGAGRGAMGMDPDSGSSSLYLYFIHLYDVSDSGHKRHRTRSRNYSMSSTVSAYSNGISNGIGFGTSSSSMSVSPAKPSSSDRLSALRTTHFTMNSTGSAYSSYSAYGGHRSPYGVSAQSQGQSQRAAPYWKVLLNFVTAKKSESYSITDRNITVKELRMNIAAKFKTECDRIKVGNDLMSDFKLLRDYNLQQNEILHVYDESMVTIFVQQSGLEMPSKAMDRRLHDRSPSISSSQRGSNEAIELKLNRKLTVQHIKYQISNILRYPMKSQTLIMKEVLRDNQLISECGLKNGDTVRLVYSFGKRVKKLPNQRLKVPVVTFDGDERFELIVDRDIVIHDLVQIIEAQKGIHHNKQMLLFHGMELPRDHRLSDFNVTHELHLKIVK